MKNNKKTKSTHTKKIVTKKNKKKKMLGGAPNNIPDGYQDLPVKEKADHWDKVKNQQEHIENSSSDGGVVPAKINQTEPNKEHARQQWTDVKGAVDTAGTIAKHATQANNNKIQQQEQEQQARQQWKDVKGAVDTAGTIAKHATQTNNNKIQQQALQQWNDVKGAVDTAGTIAKHATQANENKLDLNDIISRLDGFEQLDHEKQEEYKQLISHYRDNIYKCQELEQAYITKHQEIGELNQLFNALAESIKSKINIDRTLIDYLKQVWVDLDANGTKIHNLDDYINIQNNWQTDLGRTIDEIDGLVTYVKNPENMEQAMKYAKSITQLVAKEKPDQETLDNLVK